MSIERQCRVCRCTDITRRLRDDGSPCCWMDDDLCSVCHDQLAELPEKLAAVLAEIVDATLLELPGTPTDPVSLRLAHFKPELAERAASLLEEAEHL